MAAGLKVLDLTDEEVSGVEQAGGEVEFAGGAGGEFDAAAEQASCSEAEKERTVGFDAVSETGLTSAVWGKIVGNPPLSCTTRHRGSGESAGCETASRKAARLT
jgi:hypothetical protein